MNVDEKIYLDIILPLPLPNTFTYSISSTEHEAIDVGKRVAVPFGKSKVYFGIIKDIHYEHRKNYEIKDIISILDDERIVEPIHIQLWEWIAAYYMCHLGEVMNAAIPSAFKLSSENALILNETIKIKHADYNEEEQFIIRYIEEKKMVSLSELLGKSHFSNTVVVVNKLVEKEVIYVYEEIKQRYQPKIEKVVRLSAKYQQDSNELKHLLEKLEKKEKQLNVLLSYISRSKKADLVYKKKLLSDASISSSSYNTLLKNGVLEEEDIIVSRLESKTNTDIEKYTLNNEQKNALKKINSLLKKIDTVLLFGVTASGKTLVYQELINQYIEKNNDAQILYLVPEIALTTQLIRRIRKSLRTEIGVYHSALSPNERVEIWNKVKTGEYKVVLGARSALFLPFKQLKLIIIDEEHEPSFKQQDPAPRYHARDTAIMYAHLTGAKVVLGSATPSVESYAHATSGKYGLATLARRYSEVNLPKIDIIHFNKTPHSERRSLLLEEALLTEIEQRVEKKEQVILFQNKRGFVPVMMCRVCGHYPKCKNCDVSMTYHSFSDKLVCHYCGHKSSPPPTCAFCGSLAWDYKGIGTQKIEEEVKKVFPDYCTVRLDSDTAGNKNKLQKIINQMEENKINILIGTQMVAKGLDFSEVSLIGIVCADHLWQIPDFRASERTFQLLSQVGGRAGRREKQGKMMIQAFDINNHILSKVKNQDYIALFDEEIMERKTFNYPPFCSLVLMTIKNRDFNQLNKQVRKLYEMIHACLPAYVSAPIDPPVSRVKNLYIKYIYLKLPRNTQFLNDTKKVLLDIKLQFLKNKEFKGCHILFNVDPI